MFRTTIQYGLILVMAIASQWPAHGADNSGTTVTRTHQSQPGGESGDTDKKTSTGVALVVSNVPLSRAVSQLSTQSGVSIRMKGTVADQKVTLVVPQPTELGDVLEQLAESNQLFVRQQNDGYEIWDPSEYQKSAVVATVYILKEGVASEICDLVQPLLTTRVGKAIADNQFNRIVVYDIPEKQTAVGDLIKRLDQKLYTRVFTVRHAGPDQLANQLQILLNLRRHQIVPDSRTRQIILRSSLTLLQQAEGIVEALDVPAPSTTSGKLGSGL